MCVSVKITKQDPQLMKGTRSGSFHIKESKGGEISLKKENTTMKTPGKSSKLSSATRGSGSYNFYAIHTQYIPSVDTPNRPFRNSTGNWGEFRIVTNR